MIGSKYPDFVLGARSLLMQGMLDLDVGELVPHSARLGAEGQLDMTEGYMPMDVFRLSHWSVKHQIVPGVFVSTIKPMSELIDSNTSRLVQGLLFITIPFGGSGGFRCDYVPAGFFTDGATVPSIIKKSLWKDDDVRLDLLGVLHDWHCAIGIRGDHAAQLFTHASAHLADRHTNAIVRRLIRPVISRILRTHHAINRRLEGKRWSQDVLETISASHNNVRNHKAWALWSDLSSDAKMDLCSLANITYLDARLKRAEVPTHSITFKRGSYGIN